MFCIRSAIAGTSRFGKAEFGEKTRATRQFCKGSLVFSCGAQLLRQSAPGGSVHLSPPNGVESEFAARTAVGHNMPRAAHVWLACGAQLLRQDLLPRTRCTPHYIDCVCDTSAVAGRTAQEAVSEFAVPCAARRRRLARQPLTAGHNLRQRAIRQNLLRIACVSL